MGYFLNGKLKQVIQLCFKLRIVRMNSTVNLCSESKLVKIICAVDKNIESVKKSDAQSGEIRIRLY